MKKNGLLLLIPVILLIISCGTLKGKVWDDSIPLEQTAKIVFMEFEVNTYNGIPVNKENFVCVFIPAGNAEFSGTAWAMIYAGNYKITTLVSNAVFKCHLEAGEEYWAGAGTQWDENIKKHIWGIYLYKDKIKLRIGNPPKEKRIFIPFDPQRTSN
jgi:hypothetical protein